MCSTRYILAVAILCILTSCGGLPKDFASLPLPSQVAAYEQHFRRGGSRLTDATSHISWHGYPAAKLMGQYLIGKRAGIPEIEAVRIIQAVQLRGCSLKGTDVESILMNFLGRDNIDTATRFEAESTLKAIAEDSHIPSWDSLKGGPCSEKARP